LVNKRGISRISTAIAIIIIIVVAGIAIYYSNLPQAPTSVTTLATTSRPALRFKVAEIIPGYANDQNYGQLGYDALMALNKTYRVPVAYTENILSPTATFQTAVQQYISQGYNIIFLHGSQFASAVGTFPNSSALAARYPNVYFIVYEDNAAPHPTAPNVWVIDRGFQVGAYALGALAAMVTQTGKVGYVTGQQLPFTNAEVNAAITGIKSVRKDIQFYRTWIGDFTDPVKSGTATKAMMGLGVDVIFTGQNLGNPGVLNAVAGTNVKVAIKYTDMYKLSPNNYMTSNLYNFTAPLVYVYNKILSGVTSGYYTIPFSATTGAYLQFPITNVSPAAQNATQRICNQLSTGAIRVPFNATDPGVGPGI